MTTSKIVSDKESEKERIKESSLSHVQDLEKQLDDVSKGILKGGKNVLIISGTLMAVYLVFELITKPDKSKKRLGSILLNRIKGILMNGWILIAFSIIMEFRLIPKN